jgi:hypothetical protein
VSASSAFSSVVDARVRVPAAAIAIVIGLLAAMALFLAAGSAQAAETRPHLASFGEPGSGAGQLLLGENSGVALSQESGDVYVADTGNHRVDQFDEGGTFIRAFGADVGGPGVDTCTLTCAEGTAATLPGGFEAPTFIAVDNSAGASHGDVYVVDSAVGVVSKFDGTGVLISSWGTEGQLSGSPTLPFRTIAGITVGSSGVLQVLTTEQRRFSFDQAGGYVGEVGVGSRETLTRGLGVDSGGAAFKVNGDESIEKVDASEADIGQISFDNQRLPTVAATSLAVDPATDQLYAATLTGGSVGSIDHFVFNGSGEVVEADGGTCANFEHPESAKAGCAPTDSTPIPFTASGISVRSSGERTYLADPAGDEIAIYGAPVLVPDVITGAPTDLTTETATLNGTVDPDELEVEECFFEWGTEAGVYGNLAPCSQSGSEIGTGDEPVAVSAAISGLTEGATYHFRLVAGNENGQSAGTDRAFTASTPPLLESIAASNLTGTSADLVARINPDNGLTTYRFEYGTTTAYETSVPVPAASVGEGSSPVSVIQHLAGLQPNVTYHYRLVAENPAGPTISGDHTFIYSTGAEPLPDNRAYEMVTPPAKNGALIGGVFVGLPKIVAEDGSRLIIPSLQTFGGSEAGNAARQSEGEPFSFERTAGGWTTTPLAPRASEFSANSPFGASAETGDTLYTIPSPPGGQDDLYARYPDGSMHEIGPVSPPSDGPVGVRPYSGARTIQATADLSHVIYPYNPAATIPSVPWPFDESTGRTIYQYVGTGNTQPEMVGVSGGVGSRDVISICGTGLGQLANTDPAYYGSQSADGQTVYFTAEACPASTGHPEVPANELYARIDGEKPSAHTVSISEPSLADCSACQTEPASRREAIFEGASEDGSRVFFLTEQELLPGNPGKNLYEYDFAQPAGNRVRAVSAGDFSSGGAEVEGVVAISSDGSHVYFVAKGVLTAEPGPGGHVADAGAYNLYDSEGPAAGHPASTSFVAALSAEDVEQWAEGVGQANVTPDGRYLVFLSHAHLTADDQAPPETTQVFRYDAATGSLVRVSTGLNGFNDDGNVGGGEARIVLADKGFGRDGPPRSDPTMSHDGAFVFFQSPNALTPKALEDVPIDSQGGLAQNVYEWHEGQVHLISDGRDVNATIVAEAGTHSAVNLIGSDATGKNVFFTTADPLVPADTDTQLDFYDARICESSDPCIAPAPAPAPECQSEACRGPLATAPTATPPGTGTFAGPGNQKPRRCGKGKVAKQGKCMKKPAKKKHHHKKKAGSKRQKRTSSDRGGHK